MGHQQDKSCYIPCVRPVLCGIETAMKMLPKVLLLVLSVGVYASYADSSRSVTPDPLYSELEVFPENFLAKYPQEGQFFRAKIIVYLFFNIFSKYFAENEPRKFWTKFNKNDFNRAAIDAAFYEYFTDYAHRKRKDQIFNPLESSTSNVEDIAIDRIGEYLDNLSEVTTEQSETESYEAEVTTEQSETESYEAEVTTEPSEMEVQSYETESYEQDGVMCVIVPLRDPSFGIPGRDFPNYCDIPKTSFTCADKRVPGVYADIEAGCQVFHTCWPDRIDSFLCPIGSTFNQALQTCDFWQESDCGSWSHFDPALFPKGETSPTHTKGTSKLELDVPEYDGTCQSLVSEPLQHRMKFQPAKCKVKSLKPKATTKWDGERFNQLTDALSGVVRDTLEFIIKATEDGKGEGIAKQPKLTVKSVPKSNTRIVHPTSESPLEHGDVDTISKMLPAEPRSSLPNSRFVEKPVPKTGKYGHSKPAKLSLDSKKQLLEILMKTLELSDQILPFVESVTLDSSRKMSKSNKSKLVYVE